jgi:hypothetical protein
MHGRCPTCGRCSCCGKTTPTPPYMQPNTIRPQQPWTLPQTSPFPRHYTITSPQFGGRGMPVNYC